MSTHPYTRLFTKLVAPTPDDDETLGYEVGDVWHHEGASVYDCRDASEGAAVWDQRGSGSGTDWGDIVGTLSDQTDLQAALDAKLDDSQLEDTIANGVTTKAPSQNAVFDALALKLNTSQLEDAINNGETTKAPTENAVYDALALKLNTSQLEDAVNNGETTKAPTENAVYDALAAVLAASQPLDSDLTAIAGLSPANDSIIQRKAGAWVESTLAQLSTDLTELIQDIIGAMVAGNSETNIAVTYDDTGGKLDFSVATEVIQDIVGGMVDEAILGAILVEYVDATGKLQFTLADEAVQDIIGAMVASNTETNIAVTYDDTNGKLNFIVPIDGWIAGTGTWSYSSADDPIFVISVNADMTGIIGVGMKIKLTQTSAKYFIVHAVGAFSGGATLITVHGGTDYDLANAAITSPFFSPAKSPLGFPMDDDKWTVTATNTANAHKATPTQNVWYGGSGLTNTGISIDVPIGAWRGFGKMVLESEDTTVTDFNCYVTFSTANNSESDSSGLHTTFIALTAPSGSYKIWQPVELPIKVTVASKTTMYLNIKTSTTTADDIHMRGDVVPTIIKLVDNYL